MLYIVYYVKYGTNCGECDGLHLIWIIEGYLGCIVYLELRVVYLWMNFSECCVMPIRPLRPGNDGILTFGKDIVGVES